MEKYVSFGIREEVIECDIDITYEDFLGNIQKSFNFKEDTFSVIDLTETNFDEMMTIKVNFSITRTEKDLARERLGDITNFKDINTVRQAKDFLLVYGYKLDESGNTPLQIAVAGEKMGMIKLILKQNFDNVYCIGNKDSSPMITAICMNNIKIVKLLLKKNFDNVHEVDSNNETPLNLACSIGNKEIVKLLVEKNFSNAHIPNKEGSTPLYYATILNNLEIVKLLLNNNYDGTHKANNFGVTPLYHAVQAGYTDIVKLLLEQNFENAHQKMCRE